MTEVLREAHETAKEDGAKDLRFRDFFNVYIRRAEKKQGKNFRYLQYMDAAGESLNVYKDHGTIWRVKL